MKLITSVVGVAALSFVTSALAQIKEKASATPVPMAASPAPADGNIRVTAILEDNENRWFAAIAKHDTATIESMLAADFVGVSPMGEVQNRGAMLADVKNDKNTYISMKPETLDVHMYGRGVAVVVGTANEKRSGKDGKPIDITYRFTDTWMDRGGNWQCVASQSMLVGRRSRG